MYAKVEVLIYFSLWNICMKFESASYNGIKISFKDIFILWYKMNHCSVYYLQLMNCLWMDHAMKGLQLVPPGEPLILAKWAAAAAAAAGRKLPFKCSGNGGSVGGCGAPPLNSKGGGGWVAPCGPAWGISSMTTYAISFVVFNILRWLVLFLKTR